MATKFDDLCNKLQIDLSHPTTEELNKLIQWCENTISTDLHFEGDIQERFDSYQAFASGFLENFQTSIQADKLTEPVPAFDGMTTLQVAVDTGLNVYLQKMKPSAEQINNKINRLTLLHLAAARGNLHTTETLLSLGANPLEKSTRGEPLLATTLMLPIDHDEHMVKHKEAIYGLLSSLAKSLLQEKNESGDTILHTMSVYGYKKLIEDILAHTQELASVPNNSRHYPIHSAILNGQHECVKVLVAVPGVDKLTDSKGRNALHYAAKYGDSSMVTICLHSSISKDSVDKRLQTPLMLAAIAQNPSAVKELIDSGVQINMTDDVNRSALHYAVEANDVASVKLLLTSSQIDVNISDYQAKSSLDLVQKNTPEGDMIRDLLLEKGAKSKLEMQSS